MKGYEIMRYQTCKHGLNSSHSLDGFETLGDAIASAQTLHNPDWDISGQGIWVMDNNITDGSRSVFDSASYPPPL